MKKLLPVVFLFAVVRLLAVTPVPYAVPVSFTTKLTGNLTGTLTVNAESTVTASNSATGGTNESTVASASLRPGKSYPMNMAGSVASGTPSYKLSFVSPQGYTAYIDGVPADLYTDITVSGSYSDDHSLELRPNAASNGGMWGSFSGIAVGKAVSWSVGLGDLRTGRSAGGIVFDESDLTNSPASRARLYYGAPPANVGQIVVVKDGASNQTLRQIVTPIGFTDLVDVTNGYEIRCYFWSQVSSWTGYLYTFTGSPWKIIKVESTVANQLKITETEGAVVRVSSLTGTGTFGAVGATGGTVTTSGGNTIHTFNSSGTFTINGGISSIDYLVVGGGGGGGNNGGGGGGGSVQYLTGQSVGTGSFSVTVGAGGGNNASGSNSSFKGTTGYGGYHGAASNGESGGGSGGGGGANVTGASAGSGSNVYKGGGGNNSGAFEGGGGGGAGGDSQNAGQGGGTYTGANGLANSITGSAVSYAAGGGGGTNASTSKSGGTGGGGAGGNSVSGAGSAGASNTGSGGGGGASGNNGGNGGSGVVIVKYATPSGTTGVYTWTLQEGDGTTWLRTTTHDSSVPASGQRDDVVVVRTGGTSGTIVAKTKYHYETKAWGEEVTQVVADPDTAALTTTYTYHETSTAYGNYRRVKSVTDSTGNWTVYEYYDDFDKLGQLKYEYHPYLDAPSAAASYATTTGRVIYFEYAADWTGRHRLPTLRQESINNVVTAKSTWTIDNTSNSGSPREKADVITYRDATNSQSDRVESIRYDADPDEAGQPYLGKRADLAQSSWSVSRGTYNDSTKVFTVGSGGDHWRQLKFNGSTSSAGATVVTSFDGQSCESVYMIPNKSTLEVTIRIAQGYVYRNATYVYTGSGFSPLTYEDFTFDAYGHLTQRWASNGALTNYTYTNGRLTSSLGPDGTETQFTYDLLGRVATSTKKGAPLSGTYAAQSDITTTYTYDGAGRATQTVSAGGSLSQTTTSTYDLAGRMTQTVAPGGYTTSFGYASGGRIVTATLPGGATKITEAYLDGQAKSSTGTGVVAGFSTVTVNSSTGNVTRQANYGTPTSTALVRITADWLGRAVTETKPGFNGSDVTRTWTYNNSGQLTKLAQPGLADTLYVYNSLGEVVREGLDVTANGTLDPASDDRITDRSSYFFGPYQGGWYREQTTTTYATGGSGTGTLIDKQNWQLSGFAAGTASSSYHYDVFGNATVSVQQFDRTAKTATTTVTVPTSSTPAVQIAYNGRLMSARDQTNLTTTYGYDALGRPVTSVDPRTGTTTTTYVTGTSQVLSVTDPANIVQASYAYDSAGRTASVTNALGKVSRVDYTVRGEKLREWGDTTYPVEYGYDTWGRQTTMKTYRAGTGFTGSTWPTSTAGTADTTTWTFQESTGLLTAKTDAAGKAVAYTYTQAGQIATRAWARTLPSSSTPVTTTYAYSSTTGELTSATYNDGTPTTTYTYNRLGQSATATDTTGTRTFNYNLAGTLELQNESLPIAFYGDRRINRGYDTAAGKVGRYNRLSIGNAAGTLEYDMAYGYDVLGRLNKSYVFDYTYLADSNLLQSVGYSGWNYTDTRAYDAAHDWVASRTTAVGSTTKASFGYTRDTMGRITQVAKTGEVFSRYGNGTQGLDTAYGYDDRSQLTSEQTKLGGSSTVLTGRDDSYAFDNLGNRATATHNSQLSTYTSNSLNQYSQRTVPGVFDVAGAAASAATVTVNGSNTGVARHGDYFFKGQPLTNTSSAVYSSLSISDGTTTTALQAFLPKTPEPFAYDLDGNLTSDGRWDYTYDAENRLVSMQTHTAFSPGIIPNADARRLEFKYDYLGRRVQKVVRTGYNGTSYSATPSTDLHNLYDGWNLLYELDATASLAKVRAYVWGLDVSGSLQGAGGVGGLLYAVVYSPTVKVLLPAFDAMGNIHGLMDHATGTLAAAYEYDAFGNTLRESGPQAAANPMRFSTKYTDLETGLVYYGLRYYSPSLGRFVNKDPIEEQGGLNLYGFVGNNGVNHYDYLGMDAQGKKKSDWVPGLGYFATVITFSSGSSGSGSSSGGSTTEGKNSKGETVSYTIHSGPDGTGQVLETGVLNQHTGEWSISKTGANTTDVAAPLFPGGSRGGNGSSSGSTSPRAGSGAVTPGMRPSNSQGQLSNASCAATALMYAAQSRGLDVSEADARRAWEATLGREIDWDNTGVTNLEFAGFAADVAARLGLERAFTPAQLTSDSFPVGTIGVASVPGTVLNSHAIFVLRVPSGEVLVLDPWPANGMPGPNNPGQIGYLSFDVFARRAAPVVVLQAPRSPSREKGREDRPDD